MPAMESSEFRRILGHWASGVSVVATGTSGKLCGLTANAVASVSLQPPLILVCVEHNADSHACIRTAGVFSVNVLDAGQERIARRFATWEVDTKFEGLAFHTEVTGAPILDDALAWLDCRVWAEYPAGDHTIFVGEVVAGDAREGTPLLYYRGGYGRFVP
ncbi:MAG TPA: flavin reductase family protein [Longimicrobiales bacterium]